VKTADGMVANMTEVSAATLSNLITKKTIKNINAGNIINLIKEAIKENLNVFILKWELKYTPSENSAIVAFVDAILESITIIGSTVYS
jgi:hypothetical protein